MAHLERWARLRRVKTLRSIHLYLGCAFAPLLIYFALSGIWQRLGAHWADQPPGPIRKALIVLSTLHTGRGLKLGPNLSSPLMTALVIVMAVTLILTIVLGVVLAFRFGHRKTAIICLVGGLVVPVLACLLTAQL